MADVAAGSACRAPDPRAPDRWDAGDRADLGGVEGDVRAGHRGHVLGEEAVGRLAAAALAGEEEEDSLALRLHPKRVVQSPGHERSSPRLN